MKVKWVKKSDVEIEENTVDGSTPSVGLDPYFGN